MAQWCQYEIARQPGLAGLCQSVLASLSVQGLARYRMIRRLGAGAAGGVYLVEDRVLGGVPIALKRLEQPADRALRDSFAREFAVLASLALPGVARVFDLGVMPADEGLPPGPFFTREYVAGESLAAWAEGRSPEVVLRVLLRMLVTVSSLHVRAVVHGDLKPENVIVDEQESPHLIDFGLSSRGRLSALRASGSPLFMAPELLRGERSSMSADVYALGATIWTALSGAAPLAHLGPNAIAAKLRGELPVIDGALAQDPTRRAALEAALWALAPDPAVRAPSVDELAARLERATGLRADSGTVLGGFRAPRPRGHDALLDELVRAVQQGEGQAPIVLHGPRGTGKSTLLCALKWRLQLAGCDVLEVRCGETAVSPVAQLLRQLSVWAPSLAGALGDGSAEAYVERRAQVARIAETLTATHASAIAGERGAPLVLLIDDLERGGTLLSEVLRALFQAGAALRHPLPVVGTSDALSAPGLSQVVDVDAVAMPQIEEGALRAIVTDALGPLDESAVATLLTHAGGNPGVLVEALAFLWETGDLTARSLAERTPGDIGADLAARRVAMLESPQRALLLLLSAARAPIPPALLARIFGDALPHVQATLVRHGLVREEEGSVFASEAPVAEWLRTAHAGEVRALAKKAIATPEFAALDAVTRLELALSAACVDAAGSHAGAALRVLTARGENVEALRLCDACLALGVDAPTLALTAAECCAELGDWSRAAERGEALLADEATPDAVRARAAVVAARAHVAGARLERAIALLSSLPEGAPSTLRASALRELARVHLRRGEPDAASTTVAAGLSIAGADDPARAELLAIDGSLASDAGDDARATAQFDAALAAARALGVAREEALAFGYRAFCGERRGTFDAAQRDYEAGIAAARRAGDIGLAATYAMNLGNVGYRCGQFEQVEPSYTLAARLSRRSGRLSTALLADTNLAVLQVYLGNFARARVLAEATVVEAAQLGFDVAEAYSMKVLAEIDARTGAIEAALARAESAASVLKRFGRTHEATETWLDAAEVLLDRGGVSDVSAASARLATARELLEQHGHDDLRLRLRFLIARARAGNGDLEGGVLELGDVSRALHPERDRDLRWQVAAAESLLHAQLGNVQLSQSRAREAAAQIELLATRAPREAREAFCADPRRRAVLTRLAQDARAESAPRPDSVHGDPRTARLLELIKRLARERDLDRLLERITDAAVALSGAERGFVLLVDAKGQLAPHTVRGTGVSEADPHITFSRSIAEAVLIDGEPIVTVNARDDRRLNEFMSVHRLMLKSVACIPISSPVGVVGVLYLEHRSRAGRFQESDVDLLVAFADQTAIAIENARLWAENERRRGELEAQAEALAGANHEIERLLAARTEELEQARRDLGSARAQLERRSARHGIIGRSAPMQRVFALIERVADSPIPVVIEGESGTGKELVARAIHVSGARRKEPFVALNCAALPDQLLESELFGHVRGAFTGAERDKKGLFAQANGGTIFLDEFADMPQRMQIDLLRVLQERCIRPVGAEADLPIDVRVICASNRPLKQLLAAGKLREDLYYRMSVVEIKLPPLRERSEDIPLLCDHFLSRLVTREGARPRKLSRSALERIVACGLPGNVRQLEHLLTSAAMMAEGTLIEPHDLALDPLGDEELRPFPSARPPVLDGESEGLPADVLGFKVREKARILDALEQNGWNRAKAAHALGMPRRTFYRRLTEFNILG